VRDFQYSIVCFPRHIVIFQLYSFNNVIVVVVLILPVQRRVYDTSLLLLGYFIFCTAMKPGQVHGMNGFSWQGLRNERPVGLQAEKCTQVTLLRSREFVIIKTTKRLLILGLAKRVTEKVNQWVRRGPRIGCIEHGP